MADIIARSGAKVSAQRCTSETAKGGHLIARSTVFAFQDRPVREVCAGIDPIPGDER